MSELDIVERLRQRVWLPSSGIVLGIGDDCAIYRSPGAREDLLLSVDMCIAGVHFRPGEKPELVGHRCLGRSLSDIAAMGGAPRFCLVSLATNRNERWIDRFYDGLLGLAEVLDVALVGGDLAKASRTTCDVVVCGAVPRGQALLRSGARPGDRIFVSGPLGFAAATDYELLPWPQLRVGQEIRPLATSCMDISDGLSIDLHRLCKASDVAAELHHIPVKQGATLEMALNGGDDYQLLFTAPTQDLPVEAIEIGRIIKGPAGKVTLNGQIVPPAGYDHFRGLRYEQHIKLRSFPMRH